MNEGLVQIHSRLVVAADYMKAIADARTIDAERDVRKLAQGIEQLISALDMLTDKVLPGLSPASSEPSAIPITG